MVNGNEYNGEFKDWSRNGRGTYSFTNGDVYEGNFVNGKRHGIGAYNYANGNRFEGEFKNDKPNGQGVFRYSATGNVYEGEFIDNRMTGHGEYRTATGKLFEGELKLQRFHGRESRASRMMMPSEAEKTSPNLMGCYNSLPRERIIDLICFLDLINVLKKERTVKIVLSDVPQLSKLRDTLMSGLIFHNSTLKFGKVKKNLTDVKVFRFCGVLFPMTLSRLYVEADSATKESAVSANTYLESLIELSFGSYPTITNGYNSVVLMELNLRYIFSLAININTRAVTENYLVCNMVDVIHMLARFCEKVADYLNDQLESRGINVLFHPKPVDSLLEKLVYRQLDIHDMVRCKVNESQMKSITEFLCKEQHLEILEDAESGKEKKTKSGVPKLVFYGGVPLRTNKIGISRLPIFIEVQQYKDDKHETQEEIEDHFYYELARIQSGSRFDLANEFDSVSTYQPIKLQVDVFLDRASSLSNCLNEIDAYLQVANMSNI